MLSGQTKTRNSKEIRTENDTIDNTIGVINDAILWDDYIAKSIYCDRDASTSVSGIEDLGIYRTV